MTARASPRRIERAATAIARAGVNGNVFGVEATCELLRRGLVVDASKPTVLIVVDGETVKRETERDRDC